MRNNKKLNFDEPLREYNIRKEDPRIGGGGQLILLLIVRCEGEHEHEGSVIFSEILPPSLKFSPPHPKTKFQPLHSLKNPITF